MKARATKTYRMGQRLINAGDVFEGEEEYLRALARNKLAVILDDEEEYEIPVPAVPFREESPAEHTGGKRNRKARR